MSIEKKLKEMFALQARLNDDTNGPAWREGRTKQGKVIHWRRCVVMETAELIDSFGWKHWKSIDASPDMANIRIEIVDIWHFVMSEILRYFTVDEAVAMARGRMVECEVRVPEVWSKAEHGRLNTYLRPFEALMALALTGEQSREGAEALTEAFWRAASAAGVDFDGLYRLYIGKNALNHFRQQHGYKEGTYRKIWNGREDNAVMQAILAKTPDMGYSALMRALEEAYGATR